MSRSAYSADARNEKFQRHVPLKTKFTYFSTDVCAHII